MDAEGQGWFEWRTVDTHAEAIFGARGENEGKKTAHRMAANARARSRVSVGQGKRRLELRAQRWQEYADGKVTPFSETGTPNVPGEQ
ncbi:hypothetical protein [Sciscionella marina]|uniref:hypothetical protein n=1 Tax=Sciscionella marina TaxID=508770 RepID=UPI0012F6E69D|nr:hypothetical protein [Sciscionella marina]